MTTVSLKFAGYQGPASILNQASQCFGDALISHLGGGNLDFTLDHNVAEMGHFTKELMPLVTEGIYDFGYINCSYFANSIPEMAVFEVPFAIESRDEIFAALDGPLGAILTERIESSGPYKVLGYWDNGFRYFSNSVRAIHTPEDCRGIKMRTHSSEIYAETFRLLGFEPVQVHVSEMVDAVTAGKVDGQENPLTNIYNFGLHKMQRHITLSGHFWAASIFICNAESYAGWSTEVHEAIEKAAGVATVAQRKMAADEDDRVRAILDPTENEIIELTGEERQAFKDAVAPLTERQREKLGPELSKYLNE